MMVCLCQQLPKLLGAHHQLPWVSCRWSSIKTLFLIHDRAMDGPDGDDSTVMWKTTAQLTALLSLRVCACSSTQCPRLQAPMPTIRASAWKISEHG